MTPSFAEKQAAARAAPVRESVSVSPCVVHKMTSAVRLHKTTVSKTPQT